ncbi:MAG: CRISPR-associated protein Csx3 [Deltaproteobacteria bacterium]|nr:CRISPR-associated protein Csx3 [Deltaproteobacteria bacterium]
MKVSVKDYVEFLLVEIDLEGQVLMPEDLPGLIERVRLEVGNRYFGKGVVLSGRLPVWAYVALAHEFHAAQWVGTFDPRLNGAVVAVSHVITRKVGEVVRWTGES